MTVTPLAWELMSIILFIASAHEPPEQPIQFLYLAPRIRVCYCSATQYNLLGLN